MFEIVIGDWPKHKKFILTSCDAQYFDQYFPRFYKTYSEHWNLPIHVHIINPTQISRYRLDRLNLSYSYSNTDPEVLKWPYSHETYCQAQRFILLGYKILEHQSVLVADVDSYSLRQPNDEQRELVSSGMSFTKYNGRLMATFCNFHHSYKDKAKLAAVKMKDLIINTDTIGVDQLVIKEIFGQEIYNDLRHGEWIRHFDVKTKADLLKHNKCLIYHEKGTRGKFKGLKVEWTDIEL